MTQTPPPTDTELVERLRAVESSRPDVLGISTNWYRNPDGPEAAGRIEQLSAEIARLRAVMERCALIVNRNLHRQNEKVSDVPLLIRKALGASHE